MAPRIDFYATQNDNNVPWVVILKDENGPIDLSFATSARFYMKDSTGNVVINATAVIASDQVKNKGQVQFNFLTAHLANSGLFTAQFELLSPTVTQTFPNPGQLNVQIQSEIA